MATETTGPIEGYIEDLSPRKVSGWVWETGSNRELVIQVLFDGRLIGETGAGRFRNDLLAGGKGNGAHAFEFTFPAPILDFHHPGTITVRVRGTERMLKRTESLTARLVAEFGAAKPPAATPAIDPPPPATPPEAAPPVPEPTPVAVAPPPPPTPPEPTPPVAPPPPPPVVAPPVVAPTPLVAPPSPRPAVPSMPPPQAPPRKPVLILTGPTAGGRARALAALCGRLPGVQPSLVCLAPASAGPDGPARTLAVPDIATLAAAAAALAGEASWVAVIASPADFPALMVGAMLRRMQDSTLIVDDAPYEAMPIAAIEAALRADRAAAHDPFGPAWHGAAGLLGLGADAVLAADYAALKTGGGMLVRDGCGESFDPARHDRAARRAALGIADTDRVLLLSDGAGAADLGAALAILNDPAIVVLVGGATAEQPGLAAALPEPTRVTLCPPGSSLSVQDLLAAADAMLLAGPAEVRQEAPAMLATQAMAMAVPVFALGQAGLEDLIQLGGVTPIDDSTGLAAALATFWPNAARRGQAARALYLAEHGMRVNAVRLSIVLGALGPGVAAAAEQSVFRLIRRATGLRLPFKLLQNTAGDSQPDLVIFAEGNGTDRAETMATALLAAGRVRRVLHFDAPLSAAALEALAARDQRGGEIYAATVRRVLGLSDAPNVFRRSFVHRSGKRAERAMGRDLRPATEYPAMIEAALKEAGIAAAPLLWLESGVADAAAIRALVAPALMIVDMVGPADPMLLAEADLLLAADAGAEALGAEARPDIELVAEPDAARVWELIEEAG